MARQALIIFWQDQQQQQQELKLALLRQPKLVPQQQVLQ